MGASGEPGESVGSTRRNAAGRVGEQCAGKARKHGTRRIGECALQPCETPGPHAQRTLQSTQRDGSRACEGSNGKACWWWVRMAGHRSLRCAGGVASREWRGSSDSSSRVCFSRRPGDGNDECAMCLIEATVMVPGSNAAGMPPSVLWCAGKKATSSLLPQGRSAK